jgi:hypothetical protein
VCILGGRGYFILFYFLFYFLKQTRETRCIEKKNTPIAARAGEGGVVIASARCEESKNSWAQRAPQHRPAYENRLRRQPSNTPMASRPVNWSELKLLGGLTQLHLLTKLEQ